MSKVFVTRRELKAGDLPRVCMTCGDRTGKPMAKKLVFWPMNVRVMVGLLGLIGYLIASGSIVKIQARLPICDRHRGQWTRPHYVMWGSLAVCFVLLFGGLAVGGKSDAMPMIFMAALVLGLAGLMVGALMLAGAIRIEKVNGPDVELNKVCDDFVQALDDHRAEGDGEKDYDEYADDEPRPKKASKRRDADDEPRAKRRSRDDEEDEDDKPRPRKRNRDDDDD